MLVLVTHGALKKRSRVSTKIMNMRRAYKESANEANARKCRK